MLEVLTSALPSPTAAAPGRRNAQALSASMPPVGTSATSGNGAHRVLTYPGPTRSAGKSLTSGDHREAASTSVGVSAGR